MNLDILSLQKMKKHIKRSIRKFSKLHNEKQYFNLSENKTI